MIKLKEFGKQLNGKRSQEVGERIWDEYGYDLLELSNTELLNGYESELRDRKLRKAYLAMLYARYEDRYGREPRNISQVRTSLDLEEPRV